MTMRTGTDVRRLLIEGGRVRGSRPPMASASRSARWSPTWTRSAPTANSSAGARRQLRARPASRAGLLGVVLYLGLDRAYEHLQHHSFVFSRDAEEEFDWIYRRGEPAPDPTCYLAAPARTEPGVAPPGGEALYVLVHTPYLRPHHDWRAMLPGYRRVILDKLARTAGMRDLERRIVVERDPDAAGHPRALPRAQRRHLRAGEPRPVSRRLQAR